MAERTNAKIYELIKVIKYVDFHEAIDEEDGAVRLGIDEDDYAALVELFYEEIKVKTSPAEKQLQIMEDTIFYLHTTKYIYYHGGPDDANNAILRDLGIDVDNGLKALFDSIDKKVRGIEMKHRLVSGDIVKRKSEKHTGYEMIAMLASNLGSYLPADMSISEYIGYYKVTLNKINNGVKRSN